VTDPHLFEGRGGRGDIDGKSQNTQTWGEIESKCVFCGFVADLPPLPLPPFGRRGEGGQRWKIAKHANMG